MKALKRVLVVDDDPVVGKSIDRVLSPRGYAVITVGTGEEALSRLAEEDYDIVYTDIRMPGMDGIEVARRIKATRPWLPVLIVTGFGSDENMAAAKAAGVSGFLHKPLAPEAIEDSLLGATTAPEPALAPVAIPAAQEPSAATAERSPWQRAGQLAKNVLLFFAAPLVALLYVVIGPFIALGLLAGVAVKSLFKR